jgi:hypothetical protein
MFTYLDRDQFRDIGIEFRFTQPKKWSLKISGKDGSIILTQSGLDTPVCI